MITPRNKDRDRYPLIRKDPHSGSKSLYLNSRIPDIKKNKVMIVSRIDVRRYDLLIEDSIFIEMIV